MPIIPNPYDPEQVGSPAWKIPVEAAETAGNINIANPGTSTIGGTTITQGQYVVLGNQTDPTEHGIYLFDTSSTPLVRAAWANTSDKIDNAVVVVDNGTNERKLLSFDIDGTRILGTDPIVVTELASTTDERVKITSNDTTSNFLLPKIVGGRGTTTSEQNDGGNETLEIKDSYADATLEPTGFDDPSAITVTYDSGTRKVTLTGTFKLFYRGEVILDISASSWDSPAHAAGPDAPLFLHYDGSFTWSNTPWNFFDAQIAYVFYDDLSNFYFCLREVHGFMPWQTHLHLHNTVGTFRRSGGTFSNFAFSSTTPGDRRPDVSTTNVVDEDIETINATLTSNLYNQYYLSGTDPDFNFVEDQAEIVPVSPTLPFWNENNGGTWQQTLLSDGYYMTIWIIAAPTSSDTQSQKYRYIFFQGQNESSLADQLKLTPGDLESGGISAAFPEYVFFAKIILLRTGSNWTIEQIQQISSISSNLVSGATNTDELVKVSANDQISDYLFNKLVAGNLIDITEDNDGATETVTIDVETLSKSDISDFVEGDYVHTTGAESVAGVKTFTDNTIFSEGVGSGLSPNTLADNVVIESDQANVGASILAPSGGNANIFFGETGNGNNAAQVQYVGSVNELRLIAGGSSRIRMGSTFTRIEETFQVQIGATFALEVETDGTISTNITNYETLITDANDIPNKKYVDDNDDQAKVSANDTTSGFLNGKLTAGANIVLNEQNDGGNENLEIAVTGVTGTDELAKVTANDTTSDYLFTKIVAGTGIQINELNDGGNETLEVVNTIADTDTDELAKVSANDTTADYLFTKIVAGSNITVNELNDGGNETLEIVANIPADELVKVSANDTTANYLFPKLVAGNNIDITEQNDGGNETILIDVETLTKSDISDFVEGDYVHTTGDEDVGGIKTFTAGTITLDSPMTAADLNIGYMTSPSIDCYGIARSDASGVFCLMGNSNNPQIFLGNESNTTGSGFIDVDNNRPLNLNVLDTGAGTPAVVNIGSGGLNINSGGDLDLDGGNITLAATFTVDGVDVGSPKNSIEVDSNQYQLVGDAPAPGNNKVYATDGTGTKGWYDVSTTAGVSLQGLWKYDDNTSATNPGSGNFKLNNTDPALATALYISDETETGFDFSVILGALGIGDVIYFQNEEDAAEGALVTISSVTDNGTWYNFGFTVNDSNGSSLTDGKEFGFVFVLGVGTPTDSNLTTAAANITDNRIVRGDGGSKGIQESLWSISDLGSMTVSTSLSSGYLLDLTNTNVAGGGNGFRILAGELLGDIAFHIADANDTFQIMEMEADQGYITLGNTYAQTLIDNGIVYGVDNQHSGNAKDFNTQSGTYRVAGKDILARRTYAYTADNVQSPTGSDWAVNDFASLGNDTNNASLRVRRFDNATEEGIGFTHEIPAGATDVTFKFKTRAETTPGAGQTAIVNIYRKDIADDTAVPAWSTAQALTAFSYPANENWQFDEQTFSLASLGLTAGNIAQYEITRDGGTMAIDMTLLLLVVEYT